MRQSNERRRVATGSEPSTAADLALTFVGLVVGAGFSGDLWGAVSGAAIGAGIGRWLSLRSRLRSLTESVARLEARQTVLEGERSQAVTNPPREISSTRPADVSERPGVSSRPVATDAPPEPAATPAQSSDPADQAGPYASPVRASTPGARPASNASVPAASSSPAAPSVLQRALEAIRGFFFGGNTVVRVGLLVLLVGVTLLAKYAADNALLPIEARLACAALIGLALIVVGFRQRTLRPGFGLSLQGGGIAALYLVVFFAFRTYGLVPGGLAFGFFVGLTIASALLSVLQRSQALLVIGSLGGFLAPILASTGEGSHVALFGYYLLLIAAIAGVAWSRSWRIPSIVAFVCTYGVATRWGVLRYEEALYASTQPFVLAFMLLFTAIAVLHAWRRPPHLRGFVDGSLIFGTPLVSLILQAELVGERELGLALSTAGFGLFYAVLATWLWRAAPSAVRPLAEAFIALAVGFGTMAIPFAFDEAMTTAIAWALEGAGLYWIGARQSRFLARLAGVLLQALAALAFVASFALDQFDASLFLPIANGRALSCLSLAAAGLFIAQQSFARRDRLSVTEVRLAQTLGAWGLLWWTGGAIAEIDQFVPERWQVSALIGLVAITMIGVEVGAARRGWEPGRVLALAGLPGLGWLLLASASIQQHVLADAGWLAWPIAFAACHFLWARRVEGHPRTMAGFRSGALWLLGLVAALGASGLAEVPLALPVDWQLAGFGWGLSGVLFASMAMHANGRAPFDREADELLRSGLGPIVGLALLWVLWLQVAARGQAAPLPHLPLLNPVDVTVGLIAVAAIAWWRLLGARIAEPVSPPLRRAFIALLAGLGFVWLNGILARAVHQWTGTPFDVDDLWRSVPFQVSVSIAWTLLALAGMLLASRRAWRQVWMVCAGLLGVVVVKLFTIDLSQLSTVARIGTFLAVGAMLLVLGYLSPVPPAKASAEEGGSAGEDSAEARALERSGGNP